MAFTVQSVLSNVFGGLSSDFKKKNFSLYGQWIGIVSIFLCLALGVANLFHVSVVIVFSIICIVQALVVTFVEIPFLLRICPLTEQFTNFIRNFDENWPRCGFYLLMGVIQWLSLTVQVTSLIAVAVLFTLASSCYALAAIKKQDYLKSSIQVTGPSDSLEGQIGEHVVRNVL
ncbi:golgi apparatus membrane protein Tvp18p [[Candida] anglica]|uniref:Golgi apparatus membrane protein TVP18 n=1 Tax=[Candida] anglica TaxID=148631 RepID=A0ABP0E9K3_9ASCO